MEKMERAMTLKTKKIGNSLGEEGRRRIPRGEDQRIGQRR